MNYQDISARFVPIDLPEGIRWDDAVVVPTVKGTLKMRYGMHAYYCFNFRSAQAFRIEVKHQDIIKPGLGRFAGAAKAGRGALSKASLLFKRYHYGFSFLEQILYLTVPHTVTPLGEGRFALNLWAYFGYLEIDCRKQRVGYVLLDDDAGKSVLGSQQHFDQGTQDLTFVTYSLTDSLRRAIDLDHPVRVQLRKRALHSDHTTTLWEGHFTDYVHDVLVNKTKQYCVLCELGMYTNHQGDLIPSKVLVHDLRSRAQWQLQRFRVAAHAQFDPLDPELIYFSNHNFRFVHSSLASLLRRGGYASTFLGPASVYKYRLTEDGPEEVACFADPDLYRLTNMHVFLHRGRKLMAATSFPDAIYLVDAETLSLVRKIKVRDKGARPTNCVLGSLSPSSDGERLYVHTTRSFQVLDLASAHVLWQRDYFFRHMCFNHMVTSVDTDW